MEKKKQGFWIRIRKAIFKFEDYIEFATEKTSVSVCYFLKLLVLFSLIVSIAFTYKFFDIISNGIKYMQYNLPDFRYEEGKLKFDTDEPIIIEDKNNSYAIIINTVGDEIEDISYEAGILFLQDKVKVKTPQSTASITYNYIDIQNQYRVERFSKQDMIAYLEGSNLLFIYSVIFIVTFIYIFIIYAILILLDILMLAIFGFVITSISRVRLKFIPIFNMSIYAITLSILLNAIYIAINVLTGFTIKYFQLMYNAIAYIYLITAILMIKSDLIKQQIELMRMVQEQKRVREETETQEEKENEEKKDSEDKKEEKNPKDNPAPEGT